MTLERQDHVAEPGPEHRHHRDREQDGRDRELDVGDAHQRVVDAPARITRDEADEDAERAGEADGDHAHEQRDARAVDEPAQDVAAHLVGAEEMAAVEAGGVQALA